MSLLALLALLATPPALADGGDADGDGYELSDDCDDGDPAVFPGADERCNGVDDDCDGAVDEASAVDAAVWYRDLDGDDHGDSNFPVASCDAPAGYAASDDDCDDGDPSVNPSAEETCDGLDNDCDGAADEEGASGGSTWYRDADADGYGDAASPVSGCERPDDAVADATDCDDADATVHPSATDVWYDGVDRDCDGNDDDADGDGFPVGEDCDDTDASVFPGAEDPVYDGVDANCSGSDLDADGDGHDAAAWGGDDCDDSDPDTHPGAADQPYDGVVNDCDGRDEYDADRDGYVSAEFGGDDCDDADPTIHAGAAEVWYDGVDSDCDGNDTDADGDGFEGRIVDGDDCDDSDPSVYPSAPGYDADCVALPTAEDMAYSAFRGGGGCAASGKGAPAAAGWALVVGAVLALRRVRRGR